jgi:hypothetical protein
MKTEFRILASAIVAFWVVLSIASSQTSVAAQTKSSDTEMQILLDKVKADKKLVVAANMNLTETEGKKFWPIYDAYQKELQTINERLANTIRSYANGYVNNSLTDDQAKKLMEDAIKIDEDEVKLRNSYFSKVNAVLPAKMTARYFQIENKIRAALKYELAGGIPLVP